MAATARGVTNNRALCWSVKEEAPRDPGSLAATPIHESEVTISNRNLCQSIQVKLNQKPIDVAPYYNSYPRVLLL